MNLLIRFITPRLIRSKIFGTFCVLYCCVFAAIFAVIEEVTLLKSLIIIAVSFLIGMLVWLYMRSIMNEYFDDSGQPRQAK